MDKRLIAIFLEDYSDDIYDHIVRQRLGAKLYCLRDLNKSGLNNKRLALDGYFLDDYWGWAVPIRDPFTFEIICFRYKNFEQSVELKYYQPKGVGLVPFYPYRVDWWSIAQDPSIDLIITEGEKKASLLVQLGFACISMPGVYAFSSKPFMQSLSRFVLKGRRIYLCFDDDVRVKPEVRRALNRFTDLLLSLGADVREMVIGDENQ